MLDRLIEFLLEMVDRVLPVFVVKSYQQAALFRGGKFKAIRGAGLHFKWPFYDDVDMYAVVTTTLTLPPQSATTSDGIGVVVRAIVKYKIADLSVFGVEISDGVDAISDVTCGVIMASIQERSWAELRLSDMNAVVTKKARSEVRKWGVGVEAVTFTDMAQMRSLRLFNESPKE